MSAIILYKTSSLGNENTLVIEPRTGLWIPFDFGTWTQVRVGMYYSAPSSSSAYQTRNSVTETIGITADQDRFAFGLISGSVDAVGASGTYFVGAISDQAHLALDSTIAWAGYQQLGLAAGYSRGTTVTVGSGLNNTATRFNFGYPDSNSGTHAGFNALKFTVINSGASTQTIRVSTHSGGTATMPYSDSVLRTSINNAGYTDYSGDATWNDGAVAYPLPNNVFLWNPYYTVGLKLSAIEIIKIA